MTKSDVAPCLLLLLRFRYSRAFSLLPDAYETLLLDVLGGDPTLFVRSDRVETSWRLYDALLRQP
jgi:glucose-6-phosphate 1-dehydrogenase